ncbi:MAG: TonB-dependent receptor, partial [Balneolales bacterium]|nr:TonB-dependent receptor [Balneolales bacterium]
MNFKIITLLLLLSTIISLPSAWAQLSGEVRDMESGELISNVNVAIRGTTIGTTTDDNGRFQLSNIPNGDYILISRFVGYQRVEIPVSLPADQNRVLQIEMRRSIIDFDEVVVTASPTGSGVSYQPDRAFSGEELNRRRDVTIGQMLDGEPGVAMRSFGPAPARPVIRGFDGERILVLENGERMGDIAESSSDHLTALDPQALDRLEVVRGPASLLYGTSALGGVVNLITSDIPTDWSSGTSGTLSTNVSSVNEMWSGYSRLTYGRENSAFTGRFSYRTAGDLKTPQGRLNGTDLENIEGSAGYGFRSGETIGGISVMGLQSTYGIPEGDYDPDERIEIRLNRLATQGRLDFKRDGFFDQVQIKFHASHFFQEEVEMDFNPDGSIDEEVEIEYDQLAFSSTVYLQHKPVGIFDRGVVGFNVNGRVLDVGGAEAYTPGEQYINPALFTFQEIPVSPVMRIQVGARLDYRNLNTRQNDQNSEIDENKSDVDIAGSIGLNLRPWTDTEIGVQVARAHRYPTAEELFSDGAHLAAGVYEIGDPTLTTEKGYGLDAFLRYRLGIAEFEVAGFVNMVRGFIAFQPTGQTDAGSGLPIFRYEGSDARLFGGEVQMALALTPQLSLTGGIDYVNGTQIGGSEEPLPFMPP